MHSAHRDASWLPSDAGFPHSEISGSRPVCRLPGAYRRLPRPSSPLDAKASTMHPYELDRMNDRLSFTRANKSPLARVVTPSDPPHPPARRIDQLRDFGPVVQLTNGTLMTIRRPRLHDAVSRTVAYVYPIQLSKSIRRFEEQRSARRIPLRRRLRCCPSCPQ
jgi:hypothetical protein